MPVFDRFKRRLRLEHRLFFVIFLEVLFALEHGEESLNRSDAHLRGRVDRVLSETLDVELFGEFIVRVRALILLVFVKRLLPQIVPVDEKENPLRLRVLDQPVRKRARSAGLAAPGRHLNEGSRAVVGERLFKSLDRVHLDSPKSGCNELRHVPEIRPQLVVSKCDETMEFLGSVETEDFTAAGMGIEAVRELRDDAGRFVSKRQRETEVWELVWNTARVLGRLRLHTGERVTCGLRFDHTDGLRLDVEEIISEAAFEREFANSDPAPRREIHLGVVLDVPTAVRELAINLVPGFFFRFHDRSS